MSYLNMQSFWEFKADALTACKNNAKSQVLEKNQPKQIFQLIFCDLNQLLLSLEISKFE